MTSKEELENFELALKCDVEERRMPVVYGLDIQGWVCQRLWINRATGEVMKIERINNE